MLILVPGTTQSAKNHLKWAFMRLFQTRVKPCVHIFSQNGAYRIWTFLDLIPDGELYAAQHGSQPTSLPDWRPDINRDWVGRVATLYSLCDLVNYALQTLINNQITHRVFSWDFELPAQIMPGSVNPQLKSCRTYLQRHLQTSPPTYQKSYPKFQNPRTTFQNTAVFHPKSQSKGGRGGFPEK